MILIIIEITGKLHKNVACQITNLILSFIMLKFMIYLKETRNSFKK